MELQHAMVSVKGLETTFFTKQGPLKAVNNVSYDIPKGKTLGIVGESGCGKSVTSFSLMGLVSPPGRVTAGSFRLGGEEVFGRSETEMQKIRGRKVAMIFQEPMTALNPVLTIGYQMSEQIIQHMGLNRQQSRERAIEMLELVGIPSPASRYRCYPHELSGGMRQRAMIAMALSCEPEFLIADEPTTALDVTIQAQILSLMQDLQKKFDMTMQFITHDLGVIFELADHVMIMYAGKTCESGETKDIFENPKHPYTQALLESIPRLGRRVSRLPTIEGTVPALHQLPVGCPFQNRCRKVSSQCREQEPTLRPVGDGHYVSCHNA